MRAQGRAQFFDHPVVNQNRTQEGRLGFEVGGQLAPCAISVLSVVAWEQQCLGVFHGALMPPPLALEQGQNTAINLMRKGLLCG